MTVCKSCKAEIFWAKTETDKRMPVDAKPDPRGTLVVFERDGERRAFHAANAPADVETPDRYVAHWATCQFAWKHKQPRG